MVVHDLDLDHRIHIDLLDLDHEHRSNYLFDHSCLLDRWFLSGILSVYYYDFERLYGIWMFNDHKLHICVTTSCFSDYVENIVYYDQLGIHIYYSISKIVFYGPLLFVCTHLGDNYPLYVLPQCMWCTILHCIV